MDLKVGKSKLSGVINIPGSKSHTIRAIVLALLSDGISTIKNPLCSDDTVSCLEAASTLGAWIITPPFSGRIFETISARSLL